MRILPKGLLPRDFRRITESVWNYDARQSGSYFCNSLVWETAGWDFKILLNFAIR